MSYNIQYIYFIGCRQSYRSRQISYRKNIFIYKISLISIQLHGLVQCLILELYLSVYKQYYTSTDHYAGSFLVAGDDSCPDTWLVIYSILLSMMETSCIIIFFMMTTPIDTYMNHMFHFHQVYVWPCKITNCNFTLVRTSSRLYLLYQ